MTEGDADEFTPEDIPNLSLERIAGRRQYLAVASVAMFGHPQDQSSALAALNALAVRTDDAEAFLWWWRTLTKAPRRADAWRSSSTQLAKRVAVPEPLEDEVFQVLTEERSPQARQVTVHDQFKEHLFARLDPSTPLARRVAATVVGGTHTPDLIERAHSVLGASCDAADRRVVLQAAERHGNWDLKVLLHLITPQSEVELTAIRAGVQQHLRNLQDAQRDAAATLLARLNLEDVQDLLLAQPTGTPKLVAGGFLQRLGAAQVKHLLEQVKSRKQSAVAAEDEAAVANTELVISVLLGGITNLNDAAHDLAVWAAGTFGVDSLQGYRQQQVRTATSSFGDERRRVEARQRLLDLLAVDASNALIDDLAAAISITQLRPEAVGGLPHEAQRILGQALAQRAAQGALGTDEQMVEGLLKMAKQAPLSHVTPVVGGFISASRSADPRLVELLADPAGVGEAVWAKVAEPVAHALGRAENQVSVRLAAVSAALAGEDGDVEAFLKLIAPAELTAEAAHELAGRLQARPAVLAGYTQRLLLSVNGPEAHAVPPAALAAVLEAAVRAGVLDDLTPSGDLFEAARAAVHIPTGALQETLASWLGCAPLSDAVLDLVVAADESHTDATNPFAATRVKLAGRFGDRARDVSLETSERVSNLQATARADNSTARQVALVLLNTSQVELRRASGEILAVSGGGLEEVPVLEERAAVETDRVALGHITRALRRIRSGSAAEAVHNLMALLDLTQEVPDPEIAVLLPHAQWHDTFVDCVDKLRGAVTTNPDGATQEALRLGELLVEQAVATLWASESRTQKQARSLLENAPDKQPIGALLKRQDLLERFPWLHAYATIREDRSVHPAPRGRTAPIAADGAPLNLALVGRVVRGWAGAMYELRP